MGEEREEGSENERMIGDDREENRRKRGKKMTRME